MNVKASLNASSDNYYINFHIPELFVNTVELINDKVGMLGSDY